MLTVITQFGELLSEFGNFAAENQTAFIAAGTTFASVIGVFLKVKSLFTKKTTELAEAAAADNAETKKLLSEIKEELYETKKDNAKLATAFNEAFANSKLNSETKLSITNTLKDVSGISGELGNKLTETTNEIIENTPVTEAIDKISEDIKKQGTSILSRFLNVEDGE